MSESLDALQGRRERLHLLFDGLETDGPWDQRVAMVASMASSLIFVVLASRAPDEAKANIADELLSLSDSVLSLNRESTGVADITAIRLNLEKLGDKADKALVI